jgi:hypothetical protein
MPVMIGVDPHKASHTAAALDDHGQLLDQQHPGHPGRLPAAAPVGRALATTLLGGGGRPHRLFRAGDRKLNHALYMMAMVQVRRPSAGQAYYQRKLAEGESPRRPCGA